MIQGSNRKIRVLIVDDSRTFQNLMKKALLSESDIEIVGALESGTEILNVLNKNPVDVITLDVEMPGMDGFETLEQVQKYNKNNPQQRDVGVIMVSAFTRKGADITIKALEAGAFDFITKPVAANINEGIKILRRQLLVKIRHFSIISLRKPIEKEKSTIVKKPESKPPENLQAILIGVSTGGPKALAEILPKMSAHIELPILIVQHMPAHFTSSLAETLNKKCSHQVKEPKNGEMVAHRHIYLAPGGKHMLVRKKGIEKERIIINESPPENGFRPSVDVLFRSAAPVYKNQAVAIILTGMGTDGTRGLAALKRVNAYSIAQDEKSSVVWGMPGSAVQSGNVDEILSLEKIPNAVMQLVKK